MTQKQHRKITDQQLKADVVAELAFTSTVDATNIGVSVTDGAVSLTGATTTLPARIAAERATLRVRGVKAVADDMVVRPNGPTGAADLDIARAAGHNLDWAVDVPADTVKAEVRDHVLTLTGTVRWDYQRRAAARAVTYIRGVSRVDNHILLDQPVSPAVVVDAIEAALVRNVLIDVEHITVKATDHHLTLSGNVRSFDELRQAGLAAWNVPGVTSVDNALRVTI